MKEYLVKPWEELNQKNLIRWNVMPDETELFRQMAGEMFAYIKKSSQTGKPVVMVIPVGPIDQYRHLVRLCNENKVSCKNVVFINMDEYCTAAGEWVGLQDPVSFRGFMESRFYSLLKEEYRPLRENCLFPDPHDLTNIERKIAKIGGLDVVFGGVGINGHIAFNEPEPHLTEAEYLNLPTRVLELARETKIMNASLCAGGNIDAMPPQCITVGFKTLFSAQRIFLYCFRSWQAIAVRQALFGTATTECPITLLQKHQNVTINFSENVMRNAIPSVL